MLNELINFHQELMSTIDTRLKRALYNDIHWDAQSICIYGGRGTGKTTMLCQHLLDRYKSAKEALYISADNIHVLSNGLLNIASRYFDLGGKALFIDEIHKYPDWAIEIKNIIDVYRKKQIIFSGSSASELKQSKSDLSRRVLYHELPGLSFREYLIFTNTKNIAAFTLKEVLSNHTQLAEQFGDVAILKHFKDYLLHGYYPFFLENLDAYLLKLNNVIETTISEDIATTKGVKPSTIIILKKLLWLVATAKCFSPNVDKIAKNLSVAREVIYNGFEYLQQAGLINSIYPKAKGMKLIRKPAKIFMNNTNLLHAINGDLSLESDIGSARETYFANQIGINHHLHTHDTADFLIDQQYVIEIGGRHKNKKQISTIENAFLAVDNIKVGVGNRIPLYLFGCLY